MKLILDTHVFLWSLSNPGRIPKAKRLVIESMSNEVYVSSISIAEIAIKASLGKLELTFDPVAQAEGCGFELLDFRGRDAVLLRRMPFHHRDPFDRMLIAQSQANGMPILTTDRKFERYDCVLV